MNYVDRPDVDDYDALFRFVRNARLKRFPLLLEKQAALITAYKLYLDNNGNASVITAANLDEEHADLLRYYYDNPPKELGHIDEIRDTSADKVCAMCGSFGSETLDHVLPQATYPEFSVLSANLVPACPCNTLRSNVVVGANAEERVLHPYFDNCLSERLLVARFVAPFDEAPGISVEIIVAQDHPHRTAIVFHFNAVVKKTAILNHLIRRWGILYRRPSVLLPTLTPGETVETLRAKISTELHRLDHLHGSLNNWDSVFIAGLLDETVLAWLFEHLQVDNVLL